MSDIVEKLQHWRSALKPMSEALVLEAIDRIERLESDNESLLSELQAERRISDGRRQEIERLRHDIQVVRDDCIQACYRAMRKVPYADASDCAEAIRELK